MSNAIKIVSNCNWRQFKYRNEVPAKVLADQFDYQVTSETACGGCDRQAGCERDPWECDDYAGPIDGFFCYRGVWYHLDMFMGGGIACDLMIGSGAGVVWTGHHGDSFFSGVVIRLSDDGEEYQIGTYYACDGDLS